MRILSHQRGELIMRSSFRSKSYLGIFGSLGLLIVFASMACSGNERTSPRNPAQFECETPGRECAESVLDHYRGADGEIMLKRPYVWVDGTFSHFAATVSSGEPPSDKIAVMADGTIETHLSARQQFAERHAEEWGALVITAARFIRDHPERVARYEMWFDGEKIAPEEVEDLLEGHNPRVREEEPFAATTDAPGTFIKQVVAFQEGITRINIHPSELEDSRPYGNADSVE